MESTSQGRQRGLTVVGVLMILFGGAEVMTGFTHKFFGALLPRFWPPELELFKRRGWRAGGDAALDQHHHAVSALELRRSRHLAAR
jgi:hypothetical protein